jgi:hypothetical protein
MIRREITLPDGAKHWLLVSQVDHARVSGHLARNWNEEFTAGVIDAIAHHDDGWAAWEANPKLNPEVGAPYSFLEMPIPAALVIWDHSIAAAAQFGPLASFIVAGHFYNLLSNSENANDPLAIAWLAAKRKLRTSWLDAWTRADSSHTLQCAKRAQEMLLVADLFSLWLCCDAPADESRESILSKSPMKLQTDTLLKRFRFSVQSFDMAGAKSAQRLESLQWSISVEPYPFAREPVVCSAPALAAPGLKYQKWDELSAASWTVKLVWRMTPGPPAAARASRKTLPNWPES